MRATLLFLVAAIGGCADAGSSGGGDLGTGTGGGGGDTPDLAMAAAPDLGAAAVCSDGDGYCKSWNVRSSCVNGQWVDETCAGGCYAGACSASACADECALGESSSSGTCKLWDVTKGAFVDNDASARLHDRARDYDRLLRAH